MCVKTNMMDCFSHVSCSGMWVSRGDETSQNLLVCLSWMCGDESSCSVDRSWVLTGRTAGSPMRRLFWRTWLCLQTRSPSQENWQLLPLDPHLWSWALPSLWAHWQHTITTLSPTSLMSFSPSSAECDPGEGGGWFLGEDPLRGGTGQLSLPRRLWPSEPAAPTGSGLSWTPAHLRVALPLPLQSCESTLCFISLLLNKTRETRESVTPS